MADPIRAALERLVAADRFVGVAGPEYAQARDAALAVLAAHPTPTPPAGGEAEELAQWLEREAEDAEEEGYAAVLYFTRLRRAAALLRQLPPEGLQASRYSVVDDGAVIQRTSWPLESWAVRSGSSCLSTAGEWEFELRPSERTDEWLATHRWPTLAAAWAALQQARRQEEVGND